MDVLTCRRVAKELIKGEEVTYEKIKTEKKASKCRICSRVCYYCYYGILSCEGCKQFFRRAIMKHTFYKCWQNKQNCDINTDVGINCRRCRLKKCLLMGMDPRKVILSDGTDGEEHKKFVEKMRKWQNRLLQGENVQIESLNLDGPDCFGKKLVDQLRSIERAHKCIWDSTRELPGEYTNRHPNLTALLADPQNLLTKADEYSTCPIEFYNKAEIISEIEAKGLFFSQKLMKLVEKDWFLCAEIAKAMPFFKMLQIEDQINLLRQIVAPFNIFTSGFYSHSISAKTVTRGNGFKAITILEPKQFKNDPKIQAILKITMCEMSERMGQLGLEYKEFLFLMAILLANSTADNLTPSGREILYKESLYYTNALQKMLQTKFGPFSGSERFAAIMNLLNVAFKAKHVQIKFTIYMEVFYEKQDPRTFFPKMGILPEGI